MDQQHPIIIFDGICELCNASVDFILKWEKRPDFLFTANQNPPGQELLKQFGENPDEVSTIYVVENGKLYKRSAAALRIARRLRFPANLLYGFIIIPGFLRDILYRWISRNRYRWFGKKDTCRIPTQEEIARFLME